MTRYCLLVSWFIFLFFEILISLFLFFVLLGEHWTLPHGDVRMFNNIMSDPTVLFPLLVGLWLTCWTQGKKKNAHWGLEVASAGSATGIYTYLSIYIGLCITHIREMDGRDKSDENWTSAAGSSCGSRRRAGWLEADWLWAPDARSHACLRYLLYGSILYLDFYFGKTMFFASSVFMSRAIVNSSTITTGQW